MITIKNLYYKYDKRFSAIFNLNIEVNNAEKILLISNNDLDIKTLLRILSKQDTDYSGEIFFDNQNLKKISLKKLSLAYITQPTFLLNHRSVNYNIAYPLIIRKANKKNALNLANELLIKYNFEYLSTKKIKLLSNYEKLIISLLRVFIRNPSYVFIDDIFNNLNEEEKKSCVNFIQLFPKTSTIIITSKNDNLITQLPNYKTIYLNNGSISANNNSTTI